MKSFANKSESCFFCQRWNELEEEARIQYLGMQTMIRNIVCHSQKAKFVEVFKAITDLIERFIAVDKSQQNIRAYVCGFLRIGQDLAINTRHLMTLTGKCKSSINSGFMSQGFKVVGIDPQSASILMSSFPFMKDQIYLTRQWTMRTHEKRKSIDTIPLEPNVTPNNNCECKLQNIDSGQYHSDEPKAKHLDHYYCDSVQSDGIYEDIDQVLSESEECGLYDSTF